MKLTDINLNGLGKFNDAHASFTVNKHHLDSSWEYQYYNGKAMLRLRQNGGTFLAIAHGGAWVLNHLPGAPCALTWIIPQDQSPARAFTNFWNPVLPSQRPGTEPAEYSCTFEPEAARYHFLHDNLTVDTEIFLPLGEVTLVTTIRIKNTGKSPRKLTLIPVLKPYLASSAMKAWDVPAWYQTCAFTRVDNVEGFWLEMRDHNGIAANRMRAAFLSNLKPTSFEVLEENFIGHGYWDSPRAVWDARLARSTTSPKIPPYGQATIDNAAIAQLNVAAIARDVEIAPGQTYEFTTVLSMLPKTPADLPPATEFVKSARFLDASVRAAELARLRDFYDKLFAIRQVNTPDEALNKYINEFLALQVYQVQNRGQTTFRGVRDTAQDATAVVEQEPAYVRQRILDVCGSQRSDGWFLRQYSTLGKHGPNDSRPYVDNGLWVFELAYEYLVYNRDFAILAEPIDWLDSDNKDPLLAHLIRLLDYYLAPENLGEHGLCKIREGDWNDSVNGAGREGRGETVMVTAHAVYCLILAADLLRNLPKNLNSGLSSQELDKTAIRFEKAAETLKANMLKHALNSEGYFNAVFNDAGKWLFSPTDSDGQHRINSTPNTFAIIAGVVQGEAREKVFQAMDALKGPHGWRLFYPPIGHPPIPKLGRIGQGDLAPGVFENGAPYNHGSNGFLARAAFVAGKGNLLYEVMRYLFPYDQQAHPVQVAKTTPYAIVNSYSEGVGQEGRGGAPFNTGSIPVAGRNVYDGFLGFRPNLHYLVIDPVMPSTWETSGGIATFRGGRFTIKILNPKHVEAGVKQLLLDGKETGTRYFDKLLGREVVGIPIDSLKPGANHEIVVTLG